MDKLKPCPFCGGAVRFKKRSFRIDCERITVKCTVCGMLFSHSQDFVYSTAARIARNESFEDAWNRRMGDTDG